LNKEIINKKKKKEKKGKKKKRRKKKKERREKLPKKQKRMAMLPPKLRRGDPKENASQSQSLSLMIRKPTKSLRFQRVKESPSLSIQMSRRTFRN